MKRFEAWRGRNLSELDVQLAWLLQRLHPDMLAESALAVALTSQALSEGHTCFPLAEYARLPETTRFFQREIHPDTIAENLCACGAAEFSGHEQKNGARPLVLHNGSLALSRWYRAERKIASDLMARAAACADVDAFKAKKLLDQLFPRQSGQETDWQREAAALFLIKRLVLICGGPGTGKTWTLARILALYLALLPEDSRYTQGIALAAPTGRAAMRLKESILDATAKLPENLRPHKASLPEPETLHRLLGYQPESGRFFYHDRNILPLDLVVIDEASMLDTLMLHALLAALPPKCRLVFCGDPGQLPPVEPGSFLQALAGLEGAPYSQALTERLSVLRPEGETAPELPLPQASAVNGLNDCRATLQTARRFTQQSGIFALASALQAEKPALALEGVLAQNWPDLIFLEPTAPDDMLSPLLQEEFGGIHQAASAETALKALSESRILTAQYCGPGGAKALNKRLRNLFFRERQEERLFYPGQPIMISQNDYEQRLFNGDTGIIWPDNEGRLTAWFADKDGLRAFLPARLPPWQTAYAITVHKAQGAEFTTVFLVLHETGRRLLTRELLYTAVTRAKKRLILMASLASLRQAAGRPLARHTNLSAMLRVTEK